MDLAIKFVGKPDNSKDDVLVNVAIKSNLTLDQNENGRNQFKTSLFNKISAQTQTLILCIYAVYEQWPEQRSLSRPSGKLAYVMIAIASSAELSCPYLHHDDHD